jgi:AcrR family transcriptional regulator
MGISERKEREKEAMRKIILDAALKLFIENGYNNVSIRKIASAIEYSPAAIYLYFEDKDSIFFELHNIGFSEFYKRQLEVQSIKDPAERLIAHGKAYVKFALENPEYYDLMFISKDPIKKIKKFENWEVGLRTFEVLRLNVSQCKEVGLFKDFPVEIVALSLWSYVHGISSLYIKQRLVPCPEQQISFTVEEALNFLTSAFK